MSDSHFEGAAAQEPGTTSLGLIGGLGQRDPLAWQRFAKLYGPLVYRWCRRASVQPTDAADLVQEVFRSVLISVPRFEHSGAAGAFRGWLAVITRNKVRDHVRQARLRPPRAIGGSTIQQRLLALIEHEDSESCEITDSDKIRMLHAVLEFIRPDFETSSWDAFWRITVEGQTAEDAACGLGISVAAARQAKYRVLKRLRAELSELSEDGLS